ncbi:NAD(P)-dependent alcohol dehydrogenase [Microbacterium pumilum]|uniref:NAD(P)-dependent alcohol dehydrogenase n=1 Tax=Microbacterium pumilum TaxID=344165 RepID=A0ABP5DDR2_9MICO
MRAAVYRRYGGPSVVEVEQIDTPVPAAGEVLVRVTASVVSTSDVAMRSGTPFAARLFAGPFRPRLRVLGSEFSGKIVAVGDGVDSFRVGEAVWGVTGTAMRAHAEFVVVRADGVIEALPAGLDPVEAAALIDATALSFLDDTAELVAGQTILINGASGAVGTAAVQLASHRGAVVTAVCSAERAGLVRSLGAQEVLDYRAGDIVTTLQDQGRTFDVVFDVFGHLGYREARCLLTPTGRYCGTVPTLPLLWRTLLTRWSKGKRGMIAFTGLRGRDAVLADLRETGSLARSGALHPVIGAVYPLERVAQAHAHVGRGRAGNIVLTMG